MNNANNVAKINTMLERIGVPDRVTADDSAEDALVTVVGRLVDFLLPQHIPSPTMFQPMGAIGQMPINAHALAFPGKPDSNGN